MIEESFFDVETDGAEAAGAGSGLSEAWRRVAITPILGQGGIGALAETEVAAFLPSLRRISTAPRRQAMPQTRTASFQVLQVCHMAEGNGSTEQWTSSLSLFI